MKPSLAARAFPSVWIRLKVPPGVWKRHVYFLANFGVAKIAIYIIPFVVASLVSADVYGAIELSQSIGLISATLLIGAPLAGANQLYLVRNHRNVSDLMAFLVCGGCFFAPAAWLVARWLGLSLSDQVVALAFGAAVIHVSNSSTFRMLGKRNLTAWADGTAMLLAGIVVLGGIALAGHATLVELGIGYFLVAMLGCLGCGLFTYRLRADNFIERLWQVSKVGFPMVTLSLLAMWLSAGGRIVVGIFSPHALSPFALAFRVSGIVLGIHQLMVTALYARVYRARTREADGLMWPFLVVAMVLLLIVSVFGRWFPSIVHLRSLQGSDVGVFRRMLPLACIQTFCWIAYAFLQLRINRSGLSGRAFWPTAVISLAGVAIIFGTGTFFTHNALVLSWLVSLHAVAYMLANIYVLHKYKLPHPKIFIVCCLGTLTLLLSVI